MQAILGPLEHKVKEVTDLNLKYEKKLKTYKQENEQLQSKLLKIEEELDNMTARGFISKQQSAEDLDRRDKLIEAYERRLQEKDKEVKNLKKLRRSRDEDLKVHFKNKRVLEERSVESGSLDEINASSKNSARRTDYSLGVLASNNIHIIGSFSGAAKDYFKALEFVSQHQDRIPLERMITGRYRLADVNTALERMKRLEEIKPLIELV